MFVPGVTGEGSQTRLAYSHAHHYRAEERSPSRPMMRERRDKALQPHGFKICITSPSRNTSLRYAIASFVPVMSGIALGAEDAYHTPPEIADCFKHDKGYGHWPTYTYVFIGRRHMMPRASFGMGRAARRERALSMRPSASACFSDKAAALSGHASPLCGRRHAHASASAPRRRDSQLHFFHRVGQQHFHYPRLLRDD